MEYSVVDELGDFIDVKSAELCNAAEFSVREIAVKDLNYCNWYF